jgi:hypothetical protein
VLLLGVLLLGVLLLGVLLLGVLLLRRLLLLLLLLLLVLLFLLLLLQPLPVLLQGPSQQVQGMQQGEKEEKEKRREEDLQETGEGVLRCRARRRAPCPWGCCRLSEGGVLAGAPGVSRTLYMPSPPAMSSDEMCTLARTAGSRPWSVCAAQRGRVWETFPVLCTPPPQRHTMSTPGEKCPLVQKRVLLGGALSVASQGFTQSYFPCAMHQLVSLCTSAAAAHASSLVVSNAALHLPRFRAGTTCNAVLGA